MRRYGLLAGIVTICASGGACAGGPGPLAAFRDWVVGCDNLGSCTAIGLEADQGSGAYVIVRRDAGPAADPRVAVSAYAQDRGGIPTLTPTIDGAGGQKAWSYPARQTGDFATADVPDGDRAGFLEALAEGDTLEVSTGQDDAELVSLSGATAAFIFLDDRQGRVGTVTALVHPGTAPAPSVPPAPTLPLTPRLPMRSLDPPPAVPAGLLAQATDPSCNGIDAVAIDLGGGTILWGVCQIAGAYNVVYRFTLATASGLRPARFESPGTASEGTASLTSPDLTGDGRLLGGLDLGRGAGDCGVRSDWAWTGEAFVLAGYSRMDACAGVPIDDWPVLYRTGPMP